MGSGPPVDRASFSDRPGLAAARAGGRVLLLVLALLPAGAPAAGEGGTFVNPLTLHAAEVGEVRSCADPTVLRWAPPGDDAWYMICTSDPLSGADRDEQGALRFRLLPTFRSDDLVSWEYAGDAVEDVPGWAEPGAGLWAPELHEHDGVYFLYFAVTDVRDYVSGEVGCASDSAIGVATAPSPGGPWAVHDQPVVRPRRSGTGCAFLGTIDPEVVRDEGGQAYLLFGGYSGGIVHRLLSPDGLLAPSTTEAPVTTSRYEAPEVFRRDGWYYLFGSPNGCCNGDLTGYSVMAGRAATPGGPYVDRHGADLLAGRTGGTPVLGADGGPYVGPGHVSVFEDRDGTAYMLYHAVERRDPFFEGEPGFTRRPVLLDPLAWDDAGWPAVRGGWGPGECHQPRPAARPGETSAPPETRRGDDPVGAVLPAYSDDFDGGLDPAWTWLREPPAGSWSLEPGLLRMDTLGTELYGDDNSAAVLVRPAPEGDFAVETELTFDLPPDGCCWDYAQAGLVLYGDDDRYLKLVHVSIGETRQLEFAKELPARGPGWPRYGGVGVGVPADTTMLRIVRRVYGSEERYTAYSRSASGGWVRGATWTHSLGSGVSIGLVAMNRPGFTARFDRVTVYELLAYPCSDPLLADPCFSAPPGEVNGLRVARLPEAGPAASRVWWERAAGATVHDVLRSDLSRLGPDAYGECLADDSLDAELVDEDRPSAGDGFTYLVRGCEPMCAWCGRWGEGRVNENPDTCP